MELNRKIAIRILLISLSASLFLGGFLFYRIGENKAAAVEFKILANGISSEKNNSICNLKKEAQADLDAIYLFLPANLKNPRPILIFNSFSSPTVGKGKYVAAQADGESITFYARNFKTVYGEDCSLSALDNLKSIIAHEYAHHIDKNTGRIERALGTTDLEYSAVVGGEFVLYNLVWKEDNLFVSEFAYPVESRIEKVKKVFSS